MGALHHEQKYPGTRHSEAHQVPARHVHGVRGGALRRLRIAQHGLPVRAIVVPVRFATLLIQLQSAVTTISNLVLACQQQWVHEHGHRLLC